MKKKSRRELVEALYGNHPIVPNLNTWHARISNAVNTGRLPNEKRFTPLVFNTWALEKFSSDLPTDIAPVRHQHLVVTPAEGICGQVGNVCVSTTPTKQGVTAKELATIELLKNEQIAHQKEQQAHTATREVLDAVRAELDEFKQRREDASFYGALGGRGKEKQH